MYAVGRERERDDAEERLAFVTWLIDEQGADVNYPPTWGISKRALRLAGSPELESALMDRGADSGSCNSRDSSDWTALMSLVKREKPACVARLLEYPAGRATMNVREGHEGYTALHMLCEMYHNEEGRDAMIETLLTAGASTAIKDARGKLARDNLLRESSKGCARLKEADDSGATAMLVLARQRWVASHGSRAMEAPMRERTRGGQRALLSLRVELTPLPKWTPRVKEGEECALCFWKGNCWCEAKIERARILGNLVAFLLGLGVGVEGQAVPPLPRDVFVLVMTMLMPRWDLLRKGLKGGE